VVTLNVNSQPVSVDAAPDTPLLWVLRDYLNLTGTKFGCGVALCGACTLHLDGQPTRSFAKRVDESIRALGLEVLRSPVASPKSNSICERVIGTIRRECLDWMIPLSEAHLRSILKSWGGHYNRGRPHSMLGPGVPDRRAELR